MTQLAEFDTRTTFHARVKLSERITPDNSADEVRHIVLEVDRKDLKFEIGQSIGIVVPGPHDFGNREHFRLYSIAGMGELQKGNAPTVTVCVRRCFYIDEINGERYPGVASNYLCDLKEGDSLSMSGPFRSPFQLPDDNTANLLMVGLGTGIAPFRGFVRHIYEMVGGWQGKVRLFYGAKSGIELLYMNDLKNDLSNYYDQQTFKAFEAVSPRPHLDEPIALDHALEKHAEEVWQLVQDPNTFVYVAGHEKVRELMDKAMSKIAGSEQKWERRKAELAVGDRWAELIY